MTLLDGFEERIDQALEILREDSAIHRRWYEWQEGTSDWEEETRKHPASVGDAEHHRKWEARYETIGQLLGELRGVLRAVDRAP